MNLDKETEKQIQELQLLEQNLQNILLQKQAFSLELSETENAFEELKKSDDDVYRIAGQIMIKAKKSDLLKELEQKKSLLSLRINSLEKQEQSFSKNSEELRTKVLGKIQK